MDIYNVSYPDAEANGLIAEVQSVARAFDQSMEFYLVEDIGKGSRFVSAIVFEESASEAIRLVQNSALAEFLGPRSKLVAKPLYLKREVGYYYAVINRYEG